MSMFPNTPTLLLTRIAADISGEDPTAWTEFFELYTPAMRIYLSHHGVEESEIEDIIQDVLVKLVSVLRTGKYNKDRSRFRTYLSRILHNQLVDHHRRALSQRSHLHVPLPEDVADEEIANVGENLDQAWVRSLHMAVVAHILERTALSDNTKRIFRELEISKDTCEEVAKRLGVLSATVRQVKSRVGKMAMALERRLGR